MEEKGNRALSPLIITIGLGMMLSSCASSGKVYDYVEPNAPRYVSENSVRSSALQSDHLKVVTYNIKFSENIDPALELLKTEAQLSDADIIFLQEMDGAGVKRIAEALDYNYVYYPTSKHPYHGKDFGNAILSKWAFVDDEKIIFGPSQYVDRQRVAVRGRVIVGTEAIDLVNVHMHVKIKPQERAKRLKFLIDKLPTDAKRAVIAGDFNTYWPRESRAVQDTLTSNGFIWANRNVPWTFKHWVFLNKKYFLDYIFTRGFDTIESGAINNQTPSDHIPTWSKLKL